VWFLSVKLEISLFKEFINGFYFIFIFNSCYVGNYMENGCRWRLDIIEEGKTNC
jgi:hypothetical protein